MSYKAKVWTALWAVYIIWGSTYLAIAVAGDTIPPLLAVSTRFIAAGALMAGVVMWRGGTLRIGRRELFWCVVIGCLLPGSNAVLFFAERDTPIGIASLIIASVPLWVVVLTITFAQPRIGATATIGILIAGQLVMGAAIDRFGLFGVDQIAITWPRLLGIGLLGAGAALSLSK